MFTDKQKRRYKNGNNGQSHCRRWGGGNGYEFAGVGTLSVSAQMQPVTVTKTIQGSGFIQLYKLAKNSGPNPCFFTGSVVNIDGNNHDFNSELNGIAGGSFAHRICGCELTNYNGLVENGFHLLLDYPFIFKKNITLSLTAYHSNSNSSTAWVYGQLGYYIYKVAGTELIIT